MDLDSPISSPATGSGLGHSIATSLRALIAGNASAARTELGLGTAATAASGDFISSAAGSVATANLAADAVTTVKLAGGFAKHAVVAGGAAGDFTVTGIAAADELNEVLYYVGAGVAVTDISDLTSEFTITGANTINNTGGTASTGGKLVVRYTKLTA